MPHLKITEAALAHCNIANNDCQQSSKVLYQLLDISVKNFIFFKSFDSEFD